MVDRNYLSRRVYALRRKLIILYILNFVDAILTYFFIRTGNFTEANILMRVFIPNGYIFLGIKFFIPLLLVSLIYNRMLGMSKKQILTAEALVNTGLLFYAAVVFSNIVQPVLLLFI